ncbi:hypothetical protein [Mycolicibacterium tokaiense]|jgi:hypothetical protein|uniref:Uncharacterized protein n=1 Tax=Mycolicibacterium tokaiense TaxID=39695 RepID=A0A378TMU7_9MYCO|nr:hypothetical protein [Mycolicibacterium tokaiense]BBY90104.1 hypothetical protein MTOK_58860 [Mycolicibacterium tokaiense]STZ61517.1 Uncharacterised protein [Mycolicibacterium tokaiense]
MSSLLERLSTVLAEVATVEEADDALTVMQPGVVASLRVVTIADGLEMVSLTQPLAWDLPLNAKTREKVARQAAKTLLGTVALVEKVPDPAGNGAAKKSADVLLRYNFPGAGLADDALRTLILMVLSAGADVRAALS